MNRRTGERRNTTPSAERDQLAIKQAGVRHLLPPCDEDRALMTPQLCEIRVLTPIAAAL